MSEVKRFRTGYTAPKLGDADIAKRNAEYRKMKENQRRQNYYDATREAAYANKLKFDQRHREEMVPRVIHDLALEARRVYPEIIFRDYFTKLVKESLLWDQDFIDQTSDSIRYISHKYIAEAIGGLDGLKKAAKENHSAYLQKVYDVCMETGKKLAEKKKKELEKKVDANNCDKAKLDFSIDSDGEDLIDKNMDNLDIPDISEMVKNKVLEVVKDENDAQKKDDEFVSNLKNDIQQNESEGKEITDDQVKSMTVNNGDAPTNATGQDASGVTSSEVGSTESVGDDTEASEDTSKDDEKDAEDLKATAKDLKEDSAKTQKGTSDDKDLEKAAQGKEPAKPAASAKESLEQYALDGRISIQRSLFRSMMARSFNQTIKENASLDIASDGDKTSDARFGSTSVYDIYLQGENEDLSYIDFARNNTPSSVGDNTKIDRDEILAEAIGMYTILECAYSIKLISPTTKELRQTIMRNIKA